MARRPSRALQRGLTLIELTIAITIGMLVVALVLAVFLATNRSSQTQDAAAQLDDNGRFALETITRVVRLAGYRNWGGPQSSPPGYLGVGDPVLSGNDGASADTRFSDSIVVRFHGSGPTVGTADGAVTDCIGNPVPEGADLAARSVNTFSVVRNGATLDLTCDPGTGAVRLVSGIDSFQVLYGLDIAGNDRVPDTWLRGSDVGTRWDQVVAVRVALLMQGAASARGGTADDTVYRLFDAGYGNAADGGTVIDAAQQDADFRNRLHRVYTATVFLRNRTFGSDT